MKNTENSPLNANFVFPAGARAVIVSPDDDGSHIVRAIAYGQSLLNIKTELISHLNEQPIEDDWLMELRSYIDARLEARKAAHKVGGFAYPQDRSWHVVSGGSVVRELEVRA